MASSENKPSLHTYSDEEKTKIQGTLLAMWKLACVTNSLITSARTSPNMSAAEYEVDVEIAFLCAIPMHAKGAWVTMTDWYGKEEQKNCREWNDDGKRALVTYFVELAKEFGLEKGKIESEVYFGGNPTFERIWGEDEEATVEGDEGVGASGTEASGTEG